MKMKKILACVSAAALAVSAMAVSSSAAIIGADDEGNYVVNVADLLPEGVDISEVYGATIFLKEGYSLENGQGGAFIFSTASKNWKSLEWGNAGSDKDIILDEETNSITRMEDTPFFTAEDISGETGTYANIALKQYWGDDIEIEKTILLDNDGNELKAPDASESSNEEEDPVDSSNEEEDPTESTEADEKPADADFTANMGAQLDKDFNATIGEWPADGVAYGKYEDNKAEVTIGFDFGTEKVKLAGNYLGIKTDVAFDKAEGAVNSKITVTSIKADGKEIQFDASKVFVGESDDGVGGHAKITLFNEWDDNTKGNAAVDFNAINGEDGFSTLTVTFTVEAAEEADVTTPAEGETTTDGAAGDTNKPSDDKNKPTGVMFAIVPAAVAAMGVVLSKKRK